jgi:dUTP pyrophosphatase
MPLFVKKLDPRAKLPTCAHPGEDLAYDLYALEDVVLVPGVLTKVSTGIAAQHRRAILMPMTDYSVEGFGYKANVSLPAYNHIDDGLLLRDRSSMAAKGITVSGGVIDAGYTGEINVMLTFNRYLTNLQMQDRAAYGYDIAAGDKIAQMIPMPVLTNEDVVLVEELEESARGGSGYGSTGR